jgi:hypothetical protein
MGSGRRVTTDLVSLERRFTYRSLSIAQMDLEAQGGGWTPLADLRPPDPRTFARNGGVAAHLPSLYYALVSARVNAAYMPDEVDTDRWLGLDLDQAVKLVRAIVEALGVELAAA